MESVILAGGLGTRLLPYTMFMPKPMLPLGEKPLLEHIIDWNMQNGMDKIILCISYLGKIIQDYFGDGQRFGVPIQYASSPRPLATAGQLVTASDMVSDTFVCMYGDSTYDFDLRKMASHHKDSGALITIALHKHHSTIPYGVIDTDDEGRVTRWREKPQTAHDINIGCYVMEPEALGYIPSDKPWGMDALVQDVMRDGKTVLGYRTGGRFQDVGTYASYMDISREYRERLGDI